MLRSWWPFSFKKPKVHFQISSTIPDSLNITRIVPESGWNFLSTFVIPCIVLGPLNSNFTPTCLQAFSSANCLQHYRTSGTWQYSLNLLTHQAIQSACPSSHFYLSGHQQVTPKTSILHSVSFYGADIYIEPFSYGCIFFHQFHRNIFIAKIEPIFQSLANTEQIHQ